jgi:hypothetical protein
MADLVLTVGNRQQALTHTVKGSSGTAINLTGYTVTFSMWDAADGTVVVSAAAATITTAAAGLVSYAWAAADVDTAGRYFGRFTATSGTSLTVTSPADTFLVIDINALATGAEGSYAGVPGRDLDQVRFLINDTTDPWKLTDGEINWLIAQWGGVYPAASAAAEAIAASYSASAITSRRIGDLQISESQQSLAAQYYKLADRLTLQGDRLAPPIPWANSDALGATTITGNMDNTVI